jgi:hypothetical protein
MIVDEIFFESNGKSINNEMLSHPGSAYLKIMQYYSEEKILNLQSRSNNLETWEKFCSKHFAPNLEMNVKVFEKDTLFYEISIFYFIRHEL